MLGECDEVDARPLPTSLRRPLPAFSLQNLRLQLRVTAAFVGPRKPCSFGSPRSAVVSASSKSRSAWPFSKGRAGRSRHPGGRQFLRNARSIVEGWGAGGESAEDGTRGAGRLAGSTRLSRPGISARRGSMSHNAFRGSRSKCSRARAPLVTALPRAPSTLRLFWGPRRCRTRKQCPCGASRFSSRCLRGSARRGGNLCIGSICGRRESFSAGGIQARSSMTF